jgi:molybdate transport repressor ModE-like protein
MDLNRLAGAGWYHPAMASPMNIHLRPVWRFGKDKERELDYTVLALLEAIEHTGKLTQAARAAGVSHRHAWNLIERWSEFLGAPLVVIERGRGTQLSEFGAKLLWAGRRAKARLEPQLENLAAELADSLHDKKAAQPLLRIHASHDFVLSHLRQLVVKSHKVAIDLRYRGSAEALVSLRKGACEFAGFHVTDGPRGLEAANRYAEALGSDAHRLVSIATRVQGLIVAPGNPKAIQAVRDLARPDVRFINRQRDSGTRILLDRLIADEGIEASQVDGYESEEHTHAAVAAFVAGGMADAGLGIEAAALQFQLGFLPLATERYYLAAHRDTLEKPEAKFLLGLLRGDAFHDVVTELHGERPHRTGDVSSLRDTSPWSELL